MRFFTVLVHRAPMVAFYASLALSLSGGRLSARPAEDQAGMPRVDVAEINGMVGPVSGQFVEECLKNAESSGSSLLIIQLDTPGGLLSTTRDIVKLLLGSKLPVAVYVAPPGSRAGSAGVFITMAANIAAMAPGTNIGAAHPVSVGMGGSDSASVMGDKIINDAAAFIKTIANQRNRNWAWADSAVRYSVSITDKEALERNVIDLVAETVESLIDSLDGRIIALSPSDSVKLKLEGANIVTHKYNWRYKLLDRLSDPNIAFVLFMLGLIGLYFELSNPGLILPGVVGGISLILAFYAFQTLPINYAGILLIVFAIVLFIAEIKVPSFGLLTVGGIISMVLGSIMLFKGEFSPTMPEVGVSWEVLIPTLVATVLFFLFVVGKAIQIQRKKATTGTQGLVGEMGQTMTGLTPYGKVFVHGEIWRAFAPGRKLKPKTQVRVTGVSGLTLTVEPVEESQDKSG
ncbi:MAG TPA: nodulation protein NfeD [archaeon]|nr:nodulation protein NfeD [archaeon]